MMRVEKQIAFSAWVMSLEWRARNAWSLLLKLAWLQIIQSHICSGCVIVVVLVTVVVVGVVGGVSSHVIVVRMISIESCKCSKPKTLPFINSAKQKG